MLERKKPLKRSNIVAGRSTLARQSARRRRERPAGEAAAPEGATPKSAQGGLRPVSPKMAQKRKQIAEASRQALTRDHHTCQAARIWPHIACGGPLDPQHVIPRSTGPSLVADPNNIIACCRRHHLHIDANPEAARLVGLHGFSTDSLYVLSVRRFKAQGWDQ